MKTVGVRELKTHISEILRQVQEEGEVIEVTNRGEVIARVIPVQRQQPDRDGIRTAIADIDKLAAEISAYWPAGVSATDAVNDVRRDL